MKEKTRDHETGMAAPGQLPNDAPDSESRRKFGKAGLAVGSAVILTVASRPVLANYGAMCKSPSGFVSGNVSQHGTPLTCAGRTPGYWKECYHNGHYWPSGYTWGNCSENGGECNDWHNWSGGTLAKDKFNCTGHCARYGAYRNNTHYYYSLEQVMLMGGDEDPYQLGGHLVAALLNAEMGLTNNVLSVQGVKDMWNEYASKGYYEPTAGVQWGPAQIVDYLQSTMTL